MIPILYEAGETEYTTNGLGRLSDAISCTVEENLNGLYELAMTYPANGVHASDLEVDRVILAPPGNGARTQPFRIYNISKNLNGTLAVNAEHISYLLAKMVTMPFEAHSCVEALSSFQTNSATACPFIFHTDKEVTGVFTVETPTAIRELLAGRQGSILDVYGKGEYEFDRYDVTLHTNRGVDSGVVLKYGKNITELVRDADITNVYSGIVPFWANSGGELVTLSDVVWSEHRADFAHDIVKAVDFSSRWQDAPSEEDLQTAAEEYVASNEGWKPADNITVSFVALWQTEEYKDIAPLEHLSMGDRVTVRYEALGVNATAKVCRTIYNVLMDRYDSIELGTAKNNLYQSIAEPIKDEVPSLSAMDTAIANGTRLITGGLGGYVVLKTNANGKPEEILVMDNEDYTQAQNIWRFYNNGIGHSSTGYNGTFRQAWTIDGGFYTDWVTAGMMTASIIKAGILQDAQGLNTINMETGEIHLNLTAADVGAVTPQELTTQLTVLNGQITSQIEETRTEIETYYFCPPNQRSWWRLNKYADLLSFAQNEDGSWYVDLDGTSFSSYTSDAYIWQALEFEGSGSFTFTVKFQILGEVPDITTQNLALVAYTSDSDGVRYITGLRVSATDGVVSVTGTGSTTVTPDENGVYRWDSSKRISKSGTNDRFALYFLPGCVVRYELQYVEMTTTQANYYTSTQSVVSQKLDQLELAVEQLSQQASADYIPSTYLDPEMGDWYTSQGDLIQITDYQGEPAVELDGADTTQAGWQYDILRIPLAQVGTYTFQFSAWTDAAYTPASGEPIARFYYCCANPAGDDWSDVPVVVMSPSSFNVACRQSAAGTEVIYSGQITIPAETTITHDGQTYTAATQLMSRDANYGTFGLEFYFAPGIKRYIRSLSLYGSASDYARSVLSIASDMIQQEVTRASSAEGNLQAQITVNADEITQRVSKNGVISAINQTSESVTIDASKINLNGYVTIAGLGSSGNVAVDGSRITNGTVATAKIADSAVNAAKIASNAVTSAKVADANITTVKIANGAITAGKVAANAITADKIAANAVTAGKIAAGAITAGKIAANAITSDKIAANAITGKTISGGTIKQTVSGASTGGWSPSTNGTQAEIKNGIVKCGQLNINGGSNLLAEGSDDNGYRGIKCTGHFSTAGTIWCGDGSNNRNEMLDVRGGIWCNRIYSLEGGGWLSDRREKHNIVDIPKDKAESFILGLKPVSYELNARPGVVHHGFIAQDVQPIAYDGWDIVSEQEDMRSHEVTLALSYTDFIADMVSVIQTQAKKIEELERRLNSITEDDGK